MDKKKIVGFVLGLLSRACTAASGIAEWLLLAHAVGKYSLGSIEWLIGGVVLICYWQRDALLKVILAVSPRRGRLSSQNKKSEEGGRTAVPEHRKRPLQIVWDERGLIAALVCNILTKIFVLAAFQARISNGVLAVTLVMGQLLYSIFKAVRRDRSGWPILWLILGVAGVVLSVGLIGNSQNTRPDAVVYAIVASLFRLMYLPFSDGYFKSESRRSNTRRADRFNALLNVGGAVVLGLVAGVIHDPLPLKPAIVVGILFSSLVSVALGSWLEGEARKRIGSDIGLAYSSGPAFSTLGGWLVLGQDMTLLQLLGLVVVTITAFLGTKKQHDEKR